MCTLVGGVVGLRPRNAPASVWTGTDTRRFLSRDRNDFHVKITTKTTLNSQPKLSLPDIPAQGMTILAAALPSSIVELDLSNNPAVGAKGGKAIALFLLDFVRSANLRRLDVTMCNLGDEGLVSLAEGAGAAKGLEWLGVARNLNDPGSVVGAGAGSGVGKTALGEGDGRVVRFSLDQAALAFCSLIFSGLVLELHSRRRGVCS